MEPPFLNIGLFIGFPISSFRVLTYQPSTVRVPNVQALDTSYLTSSIADYSVPFHHSTLSTIPTDMQSMYLSSLPSNRVCFPSRSRFIIKTNVCVFLKGLDLFSLIQGDPQVYSFKYQRLYYFKYWDCMYVTYLNILHSSLPVVLCFSSSITEALYF